LGAVFGALLRFFAAHLAGNTVLREGIAPDDFFLQNDARIIFRYGEVRHAVHRVRRAGQTIVVFVTEVQRHQLALVCGLGVITRL